MRQVFLQAAKALLKLHSHAKILRGPCPRFFRKGSREALSLVSQSPTKLLVAWIFHDPRSLKELRTFVSKRVHTRVCSWLMASMLSASNGLGLSGEHMG